MNKVITISRQFGSGGREFGIKLAHELKLPFYDKDLISMAAQNSNLSEEFMRHYEESAPGIFSRSLYSYYQMPMTDQIYIAQSNLIKQLAAKGPCVIIGRCSDVIVEDSVKIYVHADLKKRVERKLSMDTGISPEKMEEHVRATHQKRTKSAKNITSITPTRNGAWRKIITSVWTVPSSAWTAASKRRSSS